MKKLFFEIPGEPKGKGRPRVLRSGITYTPAGTAAYENLVKLCYQEYCGAQKLEGAISATIDAYMTIPKSTSKKKHDLMAAGEIRPTKKPDVDNMVKCVLDALNGIAYHDDSAVAECLVRKWYSDDPRVEVTLEEIGSQK